ncbi:MAG: ANTAR domain-containing protein [Actinomycetota bacterium]|nr:ANTAR domain-containing protein [Actinomycetota bacterium]
MTVILEQAKGMLAERAKVDPDQAFRLLRTYARNNNRSMGQVARLLLDGTLTEAEFLAGRPARTGRHSPP